MIHIKNSYAIFIWQGEYHGGFMTSATISSQSRYLTPKSIPFIDSFACF